jgi:hypothetical protein
MVDMLMTYPSLTMDNIYTACRFTLIGLCRFVRIIVYPELTLTG